MAIDLLLLMALALYLASPALNLDPWLIPAGREFEGQMASDALLVRSITQLGTVPLWNPYVKTGLPYISDPFTHLFNPLASVPALLLGPENGSKLGIALTFLFAGIGQYVPYGWRLGLEYPDADHRTGRGILTPTPRYFISRSGAPPPHPEAALLKSLPGGDVYAMPASLPYAFVAAEPSMPYGRNPTPSPAVTPADARLGNPNRVDVRVEDASPGQYLVVLEAHMPGWRVLVDGKQAGAAENVGGYLATPVQQGTHEYAFEFAPASFQVGLWVSLATALLLLWLMVGVRWAAPSPARREGDDTRFEEAEPPRVEPGREATSPPTLGAEDIDSPTRCQR